MRRSKQRYYYDNNSVSKRIVSEQHLKQKHKETCLLFYYSVMHVGTELLLYIEIELYFTLVWYSAAVVAAVTYTRVLFLY